MGLKLQHFTGDDMIMRHTSLTVTGRNVGREDVAVSVMTGSGAAAVSALMSRRLCG